MNQASRLFCAYLRNDDGITALEFTLVAPVLLLLMFGTIEFSLIMFVTATIESATSNASRLGKTGYTEIGISQQDMIFNMIKDRTSALINTDNLEITAKSYSAFNEIGESEPFNDQNGNGTYDTGEPFDDINHNAQWDADMAQAGLGGANDIVLYTVHYDWHVITPLISSLITDDGTFPITASVVVKNEPYDVN